MDVISQAFKDLFSSDFFLSTGKIKEFFSNLASEFREFFEFVAYIFQGGKA